MIAYLRDTDAKGDYVEHSLQRNFHLYGINAVSGHSLCLFIYLLIMRYNFLVLAKYAAFTDNVEFHRVP